MSHLVEGLVNLIGMMQNSSTHDLMQIINEKNQRKHLSNWQNINVVMFVIVSLIDIGESWYYPGHFCG